MAAQSGTAAYHRACVKTPYRNDNEQYRFVIDDGVFTRPPPNKAFVRDPANGKDRPIKDIRTRGNNDVVEWKSAIDKTFADRLNS